MYLWFHCFNKMSSYFETNIKKIQKLYKAQNVKIFRGGLGKKYDSYKKKIMYAYNYQ